MLQNLKEFTILYVEDNEEISEEIAFFLTAQVKELYVAYNGKEGLAMFLEHKPDIVITDIQMPVMNGLDMIKKIREHDENVPIVITTAFNESNYLLEAIHLHVDSYEIKPLNIKKLMHSLNKIVEPKVLKKELELKQREIDEHNHYLKQFKDSVNEAAIFSVSDENGVILDINTNFEKMYGYTREELIGQNHSIVRSKDTPLELYEDMWKTIKSGKVWKGMIKNKSKDGSYFYVLSQIAPIYNLDGSFKEYISIRNDVTELEEYKLLLKDELDTTSNNLHENLNYTKQYEEAINATIAILKTDTDNIITYANENFLKLSGYSEEEIIGQKCENIRHKKDRKSEKCMAIREALSQGNVVEEILSNVSKNGEEYIVKNLFYPMLDLEGNVIEHLQIMHDLTEIMKLSEEIINTQKEVVLTMGAIGETRSKETGLHVKRVAEYSYLLAKLSGLSEKEASLLKQASPMHDIGKVGIPDSILNKPGALTDSEFEIMKTHAELGYEMLKYSKREILQTSALVAYTHHEKYDGSGYPNGLEGEEIHIFGRITAIADVFDALGHDRVYKKAWPLEDILALFKKEKGKHFDPELTELFFENLNEFLEIKNTMQDDLCSLNY